MPRVVQGSLVSPANKRGERTPSPPNYLLGSEGSGPDFVDGYSIPR